MRQSDSSIERLVVLRALGLGDLLTAVPALRAIERAFPTYQRVVVTTSGVADLVSLIGNFDVVAQPLGALPKWLADSEIAFNLHGSGPQSHRALQELRPRRLIAFANEDADVDGPKWRSNEHEVVRWCRLLAESGIVVDPDDLRIQAPMTDIARSFVGATVVHPGAASGSRRWPVERWRQVVRHERMSGRRVVITGSLSELPLCRSVAENSDLGEDVILAGRTDVVELTSVVAVADRVLCGDTGVAHVATAVGTPSVVLFGPTPPARWGPPPRCIHRVIWSGGSGDPHAEAIDPGLESISVGRVLDEIQELEKTMTTRSALTAKVTT